MNDFVPSDDGRTPSPSELASAEYAIRPELDRQLKAVIHELGDIADRDCYGSHREDTEPCDCERCSAYRAIEILNRIRLPVVRSLRPDRLCYAEKVFFDAWVKQNTRMGGINGGYGTLELILVPKDDARPAYVSQRDMDVATTVVQWMGTNCGQSFLNTCDREWKNRRVEREDFEHVTHVAEHWTEYRNKSLFVRIADSIVEKLPALNEDAKKHLSCEIRKAMLYAQKKAEVESIESQIG
jgi:hypothetical protein